MIQRFALIATLLVPALALAAPAASKTKLSDSDVKLLAHAHSVDQTNIAIGKLAQQNGSAAIKSYADMLSKDDVTADKHVAEFAKARGVAAIPDPDQTAQKAQQATVAHLSSLKGADFDREFLTTIVKGEQREVAELETELKSGADPSLRATITGILAVREAHELEALKLESAAGPTKMH